MYDKIWQSISAFKTLWKNPKIRKLYSICTLIGLNVFLNDLIIICKNYECSKLNTYLVTIFLSEWGYMYYVYIEIPSRLSPSPTFRALKNIISVICYFFLCTSVNTEWRDQLILQMQNFNIHMLISKLKNLMNCTGIPSVCISPMWPNIMNINDWNTWQLLATHYCNFIPSLFSRLAFHWKVCVCDMIYGRYLLFCFWNTINSLGNMWLC